MCEAKVLPQDQLPAPGGRVTLDPDDEQRFRTLHEETYVDLLRFVERRLGADGDAEDVLSAVYLTAWRRMKDMPEEPRPWLFGIAHKTMSNHRRGFRRRQALDVRIAEVTNMVDAGGADDADTRLDFARAWARLTAEDREALALAAFDGLTGEEAARVLGCHRSTYAMRLSRARERLRRALADNPQTKESTWITI
jgi:RNA polymerase sigma factor (sigma-70 family)